jgi:putative membrane protein insertion efficiency factor
MLDLLQSRVIIDLPGSRCICLQIGRRMLMLALCIVMPATAVAMPAGMHGPQHPLQGPATIIQPVPSAAARQAWLAPIGWFQSYVSPLDGPRCQFAPTCSSFGYAAIRDRGPWRGILMTADRLMRCSHLTDPRDYLRRPDGRLADPMADNLLEK